MHTQTHTDTGKNIRPSLTSVHPFISRATSGSAPRTSGGSERARRKRRGSSWKTFAREDSGAPISPARAKLQHYIRRRNGLDRLRLGPRPKARDYFVDSFQAPQFDATVIAAAFVPNLQPSCSPGKGYRRFRAVYLGTPGRDAIFNGRDPHAITTNFS